MQDAWPPSLPEPEDILVSVAIDGEPVSKQRGRVRSAEYERVNGRRVKVRSAGVYTPTETMSAQERIGWTLRQAQVKCNEIDDLGVRLIFRTSNRQRRDIDNMVKTVLDGCNKVVWRDDAQVVRVVADVLRGDEQPRTELLIYVVQRRARDCKTCGQEMPWQKVSLGMVYCSVACNNTEQRRGHYRVCFVCGERVYRKQQKAKSDQTFCSPECRAAGRSTCRQCGNKLNVPPRSRNRFCSPDCSDAWHRGRTRRSKPYGTCPDCGVPSSREGSRCRACWRANLPTRQTGLAGGRYDACPTCGGRKRDTAERCATCFRAGMAAGTAGRWKESTAPARTR